MAIANPGRWYNNHEYARLMYEEHMRNQQRAMFGLGDMNYDGALVDGTGTRSNKPKQNEKLLLLETEV